MFQRGSIPWFLQHELRVSWRNWFQRGRSGKRRRRAIPTPVVVIAILVALTAFVGVPVASSLRDTAIEVTPIVAFIVDAAMLLIFTLMMSQTVVVAVDAFYERGDLDLLLSSPISPKRILTVRAIAISVNPALMFGALATPFVIPMALFGHPGMLAVLVVIACLALAATAIGLAIAITLFATIGPRRTRTVAQVVAAVTGAAFVIVAQIPNIIDRGDEGPASVGFIADLLNRDSLPAIAMWPAEAALGSIVPLVLFVLAAVGLFVVVSQWVGRRFARDAAAASGADRGRKRQGRGETRFGSSAARAMIAKELRMLFRDPGLVSQVLLRVFYIVPLAIVMLTNPSESDRLVPAIVAAGAALLAGQLAGSVAWLGISAEDSPQLLASAPIPMRAFWRAKMQAALLFPAFTVLPVLLAYAIFEPLAALIGLACATASAMSAIMINLWLQKPAKRSEFRRAMSSNFAATMLELLNTMAFAITAALAVLGIVYFLIPLAVAIGILLLSRRSEATLQERMAEA